MDPERILVLDDEPEVAAFLAEFLERLGYDVVTAHSGADGLAILREGRVGLLLLDLRLGDMDGSQVMEEVQKLRSPPDIVCVTGEASLDAAIKAVEGGTAGYILKPVDPARLEPIVRRIWERRRLLRENIQLQAEMEVRLKETEAVLAIAHTASTTLDVQEALRRICRELTRLSAPTPARRTCSIPRRPATRSVRRLSRPEGHARHVPRLSAPARRAGLRGGLGGPAAGFLRQRARRSALQLSAVQALSSSVGPGTPAAPRRGSRGRLLLGLVDEAEGADRA